MSLHTSAQDSTLVKEAKLRPIKPRTQTFTAKDVILYNLGIGASATDLKYVFEDAPDFQALPTFAALLQFNHSFNDVSLDWLPNFTYFKLLHGEQYLHLHKPHLPTSGSITSQAKITQVLDKGKAASVVLSVESKDAKTGELLISGDSTIFVRDAGGFGGETQGRDRGFATESFKPPSRGPDAQVKLKTSLNQAAIYRLSGDCNSLHINPASAKVGGFVKPILHGLCFFGISGKAVYETYGPFTDFKVRFSGVLYPGETVNTRMWKENDLIVFDAICEERETTIISHAAARLFRK